HADRRRSKLISEPARRLPFRLSQPRPLLVAFAMAPRSAGIPQVSTTLQFQRPRVGGSMRLALRLFGLRWAVLLMVLAVCAETASATTVIIPADDDMIVGARAIVRGRVLAITCDFDLQGRIYTYVTLRVNEVLKGRITARRIVLKEPGGQVGLQGSLVFGAPQFKPDEEVLLYLDTWNDGSLRVHQMFLGKFAITNDAATGKT